MLEGVSQKFEDPLWSPPSPPARKSPSCKPVHEDAAWVDALLDSVVGRLRVTDKPRL
jgi:hypothetical protein